MGDILQILIIIGIIVFAVVKQIAGSSEKEKQQRRPVVLPEEDEDDWEEVEIVKGSRKPFLSHDYNHTNPYAETAKQEPSPPPPIQAETDDERSEFDIRSTEEARRAIIWSEILNRKY